MIIPLNVLKITYLFFTNALEWKIKAQRAIYDIAF